MHVEVTVATFALTSKRLRTFWRWHFVSELIENTRRDETSLRTVSRISLVHPCTRFTQRNPEQQTQQGKTTSLPPMATHWQSRRAAGAAMMAYVGCKCSGRGSEYKCTCSAHICTHANVYMCRHARTHACTHAETQTPAHAIMHMCTYAHTHAHSLPHGHMGMSVSICVNSVHPHASY